MILQVHLQFLRFEARSTLYNFCYCENHLCRACIMYSSESAAHRCPSHLEVLHCRYLRQVLLSALYSETYLETLDQNKF